jgi:Tfp pilus assembly protein PilF
MRDVSESEALFSEAKSALEDGNYQRAIEIYKAVLTECKGHTEVCERAIAALGEVYIRAMNLQLGEKYVKRALGYNPLAPHYHYLLGFRYCVDRQWERARVEFEIAVKQEPENPEYLRGLGWVLCNSSRASEGRQRLHRALALAPDDVSILTNLALVSMEAREFDKALEYAQRAASIAPSDALVQLTFEVVAGAKHFAENARGKEETAKRARHSTTISLTDRR